MGKDKLAVIDMQKVYEKGAPWACEGFDEISANIVRLIEADVCAQIGFTRFVLPDVMRGSWLRYQARYQDIHDDPSHGEITERIASLVNDHPVFDKAGYSAYRSEDFAEWADDAEHLVICGVIAECCVLATVLDAADRGADVVWLTDACASTAPDKLHMAEVILSEDFAPHVALMTTDEYLRANKKD